MILERVVINKFWGKYDLDLHLDPDVNILTGDNGSGKTTILDIIGSLLTNNILIYCCSCYDNAILYLSDNRKVESHTVNKEKIISFYINEVETTHDIFLEGLRAQCVSTFDAPMMPIDMVKKMKEENSLLKSDLDFALLRKVSDYNTFRSLILNKMQEMMDGDNPNIEKMRKLTSVLNDFKNVTNQFFNPKKNYVEKEGEIYLTLTTDTEKKITFDRLSSGEKQLLILLFSTIVQNNQECITFWDEPEISLHIEWQRKLIRVIRQLNPNMQLIIATHSPSILFEGWEERALNIEDYLKDE